jgi:hypothetical protein
MMSIWQHAILRAGGSKMPRGYYAVIAVIFFLFSSCIFIPKKNTETEYLIPSESDIPGWIITDDVINKDKSSIAEYNPAYSNNEIISYSECRYRSIDNNDIYIDLKILRFSTPLDAYGFFSSTAGFNEWVTDKKGNEFKSDLFYLRRIGDYVIYVQNKEALPFFRKEMSLLVKTVEYNIDENYRDNKLPYLIDFLKKFSGNNVIYSKKSLMEFNEIDEVFYSRVDSGKERYMVFVSERKSFNEAFNIYRSIVENERYITVEALERHRAFLKINEKNYRFISVNGNILTGLWECKTIQEAEVLLQKLNDTINEKNAGK